MQTFRIALANLRYPETPEESVTLAEQAVAQASRERADIICFPECFVPGYRGLGKSVPPLDSAFLERAWAAIAAVAAKSNVAVVLGTERLVDDARFATALVIHRDGTLAGFQDKVQLDPSEDGLYSPGRGRRVFRPARWCSASLSVMMAGAILKRSAGRCGGSARRFPPAFSTKLNPAATGPQVSPIPRTLSMRRRHCAALLRTPAILRP